VERWFGIITQRAIRHGSFSSVKELINKIEELVPAYDKTKAPFNWRATADSILEKLQRLCSRISGTAHYETVAHRTALEFSTDFLESAHLPPPTWPQASVAEALGRCPGGGSGRPDRHLQIPGEPHLRRHRHSGAGLFEPAPAGERLRLRLPRRHLPPRPA
jgi:hypothetical protein